MSNVLDQLFSEKLASALYVTGVEKFNNLEYQTWLNDVYNNAIFGFAILAIALILLSQILSRINKPKASKIVLYSTAIPFVISVFMTIYGQINQKQEDQSLVYNPIVSVRGVSPETIDYYRSFNDNNLDSTQQFHKKDFRIAYAHEYTNEDKEVTDAVKTFCEVILHPLDPTKDMITLNLITYKDLNIDGCNKGSVVID